MLSSPSHGSMSVVARSLRTVIVWTRCPVAPRIHQDRKFRRPPAPTSTSSLPRSIARRTTSGSRRLMVCAATGLGVIYLPLLREEATGLGKQLGSWRLERPCGVVKLSDVVRQPQDRKSVV